VAAWKSLMLDGLRLQPGMQVLDAGYGIGTDAFELAGLVNPGGAVTVFGGFEAGNAQALSASGGFE